MINIKLKNIFCFLFLLILGSCNKEYFTTGIELYDSQFLNLESISFPIYSYQKKLERVQSNNLSNVHLGQYSDESFGLIRSSFVSQLDVTNLDIFGDFSQATEDEGSDTDIRVIDEEEELTNVYLDIPFFNNSNDKDSDGVIDLFDVDPNNSSSDSDGDGISDIDELRAELNPLSSDSDGDGILDADDTDNEGYDSSKRVYEIDSVYGNRDATFNLKVHELKYYLSSLDPSNNFESESEYYSDFDFYENGHAGRLLFDQTINLDFNEVPVLYFDDDPETTSNELEEINYYETPRIRVPLDINFFQSKIIDLEGKDPLINKANFNNHLRGLIVQAENFSDDLYMILDISNAGIVLQYTYNFYNTNGTTDQSDDIVERKTKSNSIPLGGIHVNQYNNSTSNIDIDEGLTDKILLNGSNYISKLKLFSKNNYEITNELKAFKEKDVLINEANIILYIDKTLGSSNKETLPKRLYLYSYSNGDPIEDYNKDFSESFNEYVVNENKYVFGGLLQYDSDNKPLSYKFNITNHIANIIRYDSLNIDLGLTVTSDVNDINLKNAFLSDDQKIKLPAHSLTYPFPVILNGSNTGNLETENGLKLEILYSKY
tara:strand:- start:3353 stop:5158 length:1806 start_codon:yes stop_codon:yes gene_type:complete